MSIILIIAICLLVIVTIILIWGGVTRWKFIPKKKEYFDEQEAFLDKYNKNSLDGIEYVNNVPKVVFVIWMGAYKTGIPKMSDNRFKAFQSLVSNIDIPVILITEKNYKNFATPHKAFDYLSGVHKSDYLRAYLLNKYGGSYHDVKHRKKSWKNAWNDDNWLQNKDIWMYCRRETQPGHIGYPPGMKHIQNEYKKLGTMGWVICKPDTPYTNELISGIHKILDNKYEQLKKYPAKNSGGYYADRPFDFINTPPKNSYPLRWLEIMGEIFHPLMLKYTKHIKFGLPDAEGLTYK